YVDIFIKGLPTTLFDEFRSSLSVRSSPTQTAGGYLCKHPLDGFSAGLLDESNIFEWSVTIIGPSDTLYDGGFFNARMTFSNDYPQKPPTVQFTSEFWHTNAFLQRIVTSFHAEFSMTDLGPLNYFLGVSVTRDTFGMVLSQQKYATEVLKHAGMLTCNPFRTPVDTDSKIFADGDHVSDPTLYCSLAGALQYSTFTRPDISYAVQQHPLDGFSAGLLDESNIFKWSVTIIGPPDTL
nr:ribonuclease H-like domain-containing protein [Tanacetum cinerariifolium]